MTFMMFCAKKIKTIIFFFFSGSTNHFISSQNFIRKYNTYICLLTLFRYFLKFFQFFYKLYYYLKISNQSESYELRSQNIIQKINNYKVIQYKQTTDGDIVLLMVPGTTIHCIRDKPISCIPRSGIAPLHPHALVGRPIKKRV